ncbi:MAG: InlB B-repeat-containing protein [Candidatus Methanoplasma sp.]|nr:InlB B-repeat-containing protein [Candidatus Methanoplasma sp.]
MLDLKNGIEGAAVDSAFSPTAAFATDLASGGLVATINNSVDIIIDGGPAGQLTTASLLHFKLTNNGSGTVTLRGLDLTGPVGGVDLDIVGKFAVEGCSFTGFAGTALNGGKDVTISDSYFGGNSVHAAYNTGVTSAKVTFERCTFDGNTARAVTLTGGTASDVAKFSIRECYFKDNSMTNVGGALAGGGAIRLWASYFSMTVEDSIFENNRAVGVSASSGGNNTVDGGALYVSADSGVGGELNILRSNFKDNFAQDDGGAIIVLGGQTYTSINSSIANCTFDGNTVAGAQYGRADWNMWVTDGSGGAVSYFGMTESEITHCTFLNNGITNQLVGGGTSFGSVGGGGAIGIDTGELLVSVHDLPKCPTLTNNIFVGNYISNPATQTWIDAINYITSGSLGSIKERSQTGNVYLKSLTDADYQTGPGLDDPRGPLDNNGNIGWDAGRYNSDGSTKAPSGWNNNGINVSMGVVIRNIFRDWDDNGHPDDPTDDKALSESYGGQIGSSGHQSQRWAYIPSPTSDELYRDGSGPYYVASVGTDTRGYTRDVFPNAGAVEIYWTKFNPGFDGGDLGAGTGLPDSDGGNDESADWAAAVPSVIVDPDDPSKTYDVIKSLNFSSNGSYYVMTATGEPGSPSGYIMSLPRSAFAHSNEAEYGLAGLRSDQPSNPSAPVASWVYPLYQPSDRVLSTKQTLTAEWEKDMFRVDFDLRYDGDPNWYVSGEPGKEAPRLHVPKGTVIVAPDDPSRPGYTFGGWYADKPLLDRWSFSSDAVSADIVLYAKWIAAPAAGHTITATADGGSTITPDGSVWVATGGSVAFTFSAKAGYELYAVYVDGAPVTSSELASGTYVFSDVRQNHSINVASKAASSPGDDDEDRDLSPGDGDAKDGKFAALNLILAAFTIAVGLIILAVGRSRREKGDAEKKSRTALLVRIGSLVVGIVAVIAFFATEDWGLAVAVTDEWTLLMAVLLVVAAVLAIASLRFDEDLDAERA